MFFCLFVSFTVNRFDPTGSCSTSRWESYCRKFSATKRCGFWCSGLMRLVKQVCIRMIRVTITNCHRLPLLIDVSVVVFFLVIKSRFVCIYVESVKRNEHKKTNTNTNTTQRKNELISFVHLANNQPSDREKTNKQTATRKQKQSR